MYPHRIRLRGPWEYEPLARFGANGTDLPPAGRMALPCHWKEGGLVGFAGRVRFLRRFHWPGRIDFHERVWLTFAGVTKTAEVWLNSVFLGLHPGTAPFEIDVTSLLQPRNQLIVEVESSDGNGGLCGEVALEVRCTAYLRGVACSVVVQTGKYQLDVTGEVVGSAERPLELYVLFDGKTVIYSTVEAAAEGQKFNLLSEQLESASVGQHVVRVDLVNGATVWYALEQEVLVPEE